MRLCLFLSYLDENATKLKQCIIKYHKFITLYSTPISALPELTSLARNVQIIAKDHRTSHVMAEHLTQHHPVASNKNKAVVSFNVIYILAFIYHAWI